MRRQRIGVMAALALAAVVVVGGVGVRVLTPAEVSTVVATGYPVGKAARPDVIGDFSSAPLIVDGRLRVYTAARQLRADSSPVGQRWAGSPRWSYRRWPAQLVGAVAVASRVVSRWSDGRLVAIDAMSGQVAWRTEGPDPAQRTWPGRRTGSAAVFTPEGLWTVPEVAGGPAAAGMTGGPPVAGGATAGGPPAGGAVLLVRGATTLVGYDMRDGHELWRTVWDRCRNVEFSTGAGQFLVHDGCADQPALGLHDAWTGREAHRWTPPRVPLAIGGPLEVTPLGCRFGLSGCTAVRAGAVTPSGPTGVVGAAQAWLLESGAPVRAPALDPPSVYRTGAIAVDAEPSGQFVGRLIASGQLRWRWTPDAGDPAQLVAAGAAGVHFLSAGRTLVTLDPANGSERSRYRLFARSDHADDPTEWQVGQVHAVGRMIVIERLIRGATPVGPDDQYYYGLRPVLLAYT